MIAAPALMYVAAGATAIGAGISAYAAYSSGQAQAATAKYNAAVERNNAMAVAQQTQLEVERIRDRNRRLLAKQQSAIAASGVDLSSGLAYDLYSDSAVQGELDAAIALYTGRLRATGHGASATLYGKMAKDALQAGALGAASSLLGGISQSAYYGVQAKNPRIG